MVKIVIGLGSGRCGTMSLWGLLDLQVNSYVTHEALPMPWNRNPDVYEEMFSRLFSRDADIIGDSGYYWINYVEDLLQPKPDTRFICLKRNRDEVIKSMWNHSRGLNTHPTDDWFMMYPRYDTDRKSAVGLMWDEYYELAERWQDKYPDYFRIFDMDLLNTERGQEEILSFADIENPVLQVGIKLNATGDPLIIRCPVAVPNAISCNFCDDGKAMWCIKNLRNGTFTYVCQECEESGERLGSFKESIIL